MMALIHSYTLDTGAGNQVITSNLNPGDYSQFDAIRLTARLTKADSDAGDSLDIRLQDCWDGDQATPTWNDRIRLAAFTGDLSPSASAPEVQQGVIQKFGSLASTEEVSEPTGSAGASALTAATVVNGPFPGKVRSVLGPQPTWRLRIEVSGDADADADFEGVVEVHGEYTLPI